MKTADRVRITLDCTPAMKDVIDRLAEEIGVTQADVLRRAIATLNAIVQARNNGDGEPGIVKGTKLVYKLVGIL